MPIKSSLLKKPRLVEKLRAFYKYVNENDGKVGTKTRGIDLNLNNACNLRCKYCFIRKSIIGLIYKNWNAKKICLFYYLLHISHSN